MLLRRSPSFALLVVILFCAFLWWHSSQAPIIDRTPARRPPPPPPVEHQKPANREPVEHKPIKQESVAQNPEKHRPSPAREKKPAPTPHKPTLGAEKKPLRVALVTFVTEERSYMHISLQTKDHYARRHGYDLIVDYEAHAGDRGAVWWKFDMIRRLIKKDKWDWIWWLDFDTLITNTDIKVTDIIEDTLNNATNPDGIDFLLSNDCNDLNVGSFFVRSHKRSLKFFDDLDVIEAREKRKDESSQLSEQDAMTMLMEEDPASKKRTAVIPQWMVNAFPKEIPCYEEPERPWEPGFFVIHFAGAWAWVKGEDPTGDLMEKYKEEIIWGDWRKFY